MRYSSIFLLINLNVWASTLSAFEHNEDYCYFRFPEFYCTNYCHSRVKIICLINVFNNPNKIVIKYYSASSNLKISSLPHGSNIDLEMLRFCEI